MIAATTRRSHPAGRPPGPVGWGGGRRVAARTRRSVAAQAVGARRDARQGGRRRARRQCGPGAALPGIARDDAARTPHGPARFCQKRAAIIATGAGMYNDLAYTVAAGRPAPVI